MRTIAHFMLLFAATFVLMQGRASACQPGNIQPFPELLAKANYVVVVQVLSAEIDARDPAGEVVVAHVRSAETLRGKPPAIRTLHYYGGDCWGMRMDVGHYFLLATNAESSDQRVDRYRTQVMALEPFGYLPPEAWKRVGKHEDDIRSPMRLLRKAVAGQAPMPVCDIATGIARASAAPPYPTPCK